MSELNRLSKSFMKFSGVHLGAAGAATSYLADGGVLATALVLTGVQSYPMPPTQVRNLRVQCPVNALGANMVVTVLKNGAPTALTATVTTGSTALFTDVANIINFVAGDLLDLQLTSTGAGVALAFVLATLEC